MRSYYAIVLPDAEPLGDMIDHLSTSSAGGVVKLPQFTHLITPPS